MYSIIVWIIYQVIYCFLFFLIFNIIDYLQLCSCSSWASAIRFETLVIHSWASAIRFKIFVDISWASAIRFKIFVDDSWGSAIRFKIFVDNSWASAIRFKIFVDDSWASAFRFEILFIHSWASAISFKILVIHSWASAIRLHSSRANIAGFFRCNSTRPEWPFAPPVVRPTGALPTVRHRHLHFCFFLRKLSKKCLPFTMQINRHVSLSISHKNKHRLIASGCNRPQSDRLIKPSQQWFDRLFSRLLLVYLVAVRVRAWFARRIIIYNKIMHAG